MRVALEAMGDFPLEPLVAGAVAAAKADSHLRITLVGEQYPLESLVRPLGKLAPRFNVVPCSQFITRHEDASEALRIKPDSSVARCWQLLVEQKVEAIVTHGHPTALVAAGLRHRRFLANVRHPTLALAIRTPRRVCVIADVGACFASPGAHLYQSGVMATLAAQQFFLIETPTVGLLTTGTTGTALATLQEARRLILESPLASRFRGNVDAGAVMSGEVDVAICPARAGEALVAALLREEDETRLTNNAAAIPTPRAVRLLQAGFLLGMEGAAVWTAGQTDAVSVHDALGWALQWYTTGLNRLVSQELAEGPLGGLAV